MVEIEKYPCNDSNEAYARERYWYEQLNSKLNSYIPFMTKEEHKEVKKLNRKESDKLYYENNKEKLKIAMK